MDVHDIKNTMNAKFDELRNSDDYKKAKTNIKDASAKAGQKINEIRESKQYRDAASTVRNGMLDAAYEAGKVFERVKDSDQFHNAKSSAKNGFDKLAGFASELGDKARQGAQSARDAQTGGEPVTAIDGEVVDDPASDGGSQESRG